jgi:8-oxo-dGTP diphosphatase
MNDHKNGHAHIPCGLDGHEFLNNVLPGPFLGPSELGTKNYVVGFLFNLELTRVALIAKKKPAWQFGFLNGIGGSIEENESAAAAMSREFEEEAGVYIPMHKWREFALLGCFNGAKEETARVTFFTATSRALEHVETRTKEEVVVIPISILPYTRHIPNLAWLIPMATIAGRDPLVTRYDVTEVAA